jgi:hypothetical protein
MTSPSKKEKRPAEGEAEVRGETLCYVCFAEIL